MHKPTSTVDQSGGAVVDTATDAEGIRLAAMNLLARREHSLQELRFKLGRRFSCPESLDEQLSRLAAEGLQSDVRFAESLARQRISQGYGPLRLREELRERGVSELDVATAMEQLAPDWQAIATEVLRRKFGAQDAADLQEKARRIRFMQYRGFRGEHYRRLREDGSR